MLLLESGMSAQLIPMQASFGTVHMLSCFDLWWLVQADLGRHFHSLLAFQSHTHCISNLTHFDCLPIPRCMAFSPACVQRSIVPAGIDRAPVTQHANLSDSSYVTFYCRATTSKNTKWNIDTRIVRSGNYSSGGYRFSEVIVEVRENGDLVHDMYLDVPTSVDYNGTEIQCVVVLDQFLFSQPPATLIVQGKSTINQLKSVPTTLSRL